MKGESYIPMPVKGRPYNHQQQAFEFVCERYGITERTMQRHGAALLMEMGTGKTFVSIGVAGILFQFGLIKRVLIVAPLSILSVWEEEFDKFAAFPYQLTVLSGSSEKKKKQLAATPMSGLQIVVMNYESTWRLENELRSFNADLIIADEGHKIKENRSKQSKAMHALGDRAKYRLLLTGTLITNKEIDVYSQYRFVDPRIFGTSFYRFRNRYFDMTGYGNHVPVFREIMKDEFLQRMHSVAYRVTKAECLDLPDITEEVRKISLEPKAKKIYEEFKKEGIAELKDGEVTALNVLTKLLRLSQITGGHIADDDGNNYRISTAKLDALSDLVDTAMEEGKKLVIMARFIAELNDIQELLEKKKIGYAVIRGSVKERDEEIRRFQEDESCRVFVGQIAAAGLGITLTAASTMIFYSLDYSMSNFEQAKARVHRVSQKENVHYIYLAAKGTVDMKVLRALREKLDLAKALVDDYRNGKNPFDE